MNKSISIIALLIGSLASAQISFAAKANLLFPVSSASWKNISSAAVNAYDQNGKNNVGFNIGLSSKVDLPMSFFLMPELYYTTFKNEFNDPATNTNLEAKSNRIDLPVLVGYKVWGDFLGVYLGPVASYNLSKDDTFNNFKENATKDFTVGFQFGAQAQISKLIVNARYEGAFSKDQRKFINNQVLGNSNYTVEYDNRPSLFMLGLGYKF